MKILGVVDTGSDNLNGAKKVERFLELDMDVITATPNEDYAAKYDLIVCFGAGTASNLLGHNVKLMDARKHMYTYAGVPLGVTYDGKQIFAVPELRRAVITDVQWMLKYPEGGSDPHFKVVDKLNALPGAYGLDLETTTLDYFDPDARILTIAVAPNNLEVFGTIVPNNGAFHNVVNNPSVCLVGHNIKYDYNWYQDRLGPIRAKPWSTDVAAFLLDDTLPDNSLGYHTTRLLGWKYHKDMVDVKHLADEPIAQVLRYNMIDALAGVPLMDKQIGAMRERNLLPIMDLLMDLVPVFSKIERRGVYVDKEWAIRIGVTIRREREALKGQMPPLNLNSPKQLLEYIYDTLKLPILARTDGGDPTTKAEVLQQLLNEYEDELTPEQDTFLNNLLAYRKVDKLKSTYYDKLPHYTQHDGRIHTNYALCKGEWGGAGTGRLSSRNPNLQNIPVELVLRGHDESINVRGMFAATPGFQWFDADYSQLELRVVADIADEPLMLDAFRAGHDLHTSTLANLFQQDYDALVAILSDKAHADYITWKTRRIGIKRINFGILYGISPPGLARLCRKEGVNMDVSEAADLIDGWLGLYKQVAAWLRRTADEVIEHGCVVSPTGRIRTVVGASRIGPLGQRRLRQATNAPIQNFASDILLTAMYLTDKYFEERRDEAYLLMNVHDSQGGEFKGDAGEFAEAVMDIMEQQVPREIERRFNYTLTVPLKTDLNVGCRWS